MQRMNDTLNYKKFENMEYAMSDKNDPEIKNNSSEEYDVYPDNVYAENISDACNYPCLQECMGSTWNNYPFCADKCGC